MIGIHSWNPNKTQSEPKPFPKAYQRQSDENFERSNEIVKPLKEYLRSYGHSDTTTRLNVDTVWLEISRKVRVVSET